MTRQPPPRRHTDFSHITVCDAVRTRLASDYARLGTWKRVAAEIGVSAGMAQRVATTDYEPKRAKDRAAFGFPVMVPAPACACGEVHLKKGHCPHAPRPAKLAKFTAAIDWLAGRECLTPPAVRVYGRRGKAVTW